MTDKLLFQEIRKLVREQKARTTLDTQSQDFAQEYCRIEMLKKKQGKHKNPSKINHLVKNFKNVQSYINIMDIINYLPFSLDSELNKQNSNVQKEELPQIIPKSIQTKMKQKLAPILNQKYQEESIKREATIESFKKELDFGNSMTYDTSGMLNQMQATIDSDSASDKMQMIDVLRNDIKKKEIYFIEKKFDDQMKEISKLPEKIQNTKIFHKICSYLHMILEQEHREKWASRQDKKYREMRRQNSNKFIRLQEKTGDHDKNSKSLFKTTHSRFYCTTRKFDATKTAGRSTPLSSTHHNASSSKVLENQDEENDFPDPICQMRKVQSKKDFLKQNFTFRRRNVKAGLMIKINDFVDRVNNEEKKNDQMSKKYGKALQSLSQEIKTSYSRFEREQMAADGDIEEMKKYLDNTLSRNKKNLKKFHRK